MALMRDPGKLGRIVAAVRAAVSVPVTVKTRIGLVPERMLASELAQAVEEGGAQALAVHARFASNHHRGPADWETLARVKAERNIPVIGNGGVMKAEDAVAMFRATGVDAVMIGRGAVGNPWIFQEVRGLLGGGGARPHTLAEHRDTIASHLASLVELKEKESRARRRRKATADAAAALHFRAHLCRYLSGFQRWGDLRRSLNTMNSTEAVLGAVDEVIGRQARG
jgi:tRNA-dihydrouridine synthase